MRANYSVYSIGYGFRAMGFGAAASPEIKRRPYCLLVGMDQRSEPSDMQHDRSHAVGVP
jgi:hypothetical protein